MMRSVEREGTSLFGMGGKGWSSLSLTREGLLSWTSLLWLISGIGCGLFAALSPVAMVGDCWEGWTCCLPAWPPDKGIAASWPLTGGTAAAWALDGDTAATWALDGDSLDGWALDGDKPDA